MNAFSLAAVSYLYRDEGLEFRALEGIDLRIGAGEFVAIKGPSGSGKSTLLNLLGLLAQPSEGTLALFGEEVGALDGDELSVRRNESIGFIFQHFALLPRLSVLENVMLPARFKPLRAAGDALRFEERARALLKRLGIEDKASRLPAELSGGQKQRVAIARALLMQPKVLLADEPTGALDSKTSAEVMGILDELNEEGVTVIVITHDPAVAARARRVVEIRDGRLLSETLNPQREFRVPASVAAVPPPEPPGGAHEPAWHSVFRSLTFRLQTPRYALRNLLAHKLRTGLTGLGLAIGVTSVVVIAGLGEIVQDAFTNLFYNASTRKIYVYHDEGSGRRPRSGSRYWEGMDASSEFPQFAAAFKDAALVRPWIWTGDCTLQSASRSTRGRMMGLSDAEEIAELDTPVEKGRFPNDLEISHGEPVVVLGSGAVEKLFAREYPGRASAHFPVGERIQVSNCKLLQSFKVIGVLAQQDSKMGMRDNNDRVYAPLQSMLAAMGPTRVSFITALPQPGIDPLWLSRQLTGYLTMKSGNTLSFGSFVPAEIIEKIRTFLTLIQALTACIGGLCILVGGIGIMNIMIVTVAERVREIGVQRSLGAQSRHVLNQILAESVVLCLLAGSIGAGAGFLLNNLAGTAAGLYDAKLAGGIVWARSGLILGLLISCVCGIGFGFLPALRASRLDPARCLQDE